MHRVVEERNAKAMMRTKLQQRLARVYESTDTDLIRRAKGHYRKALEAALEDDYATATTHMNKAIKVLVSVRGLDNIGSIKRRNRAAMQALKGNSKRSADMIAAAFGELRAGRLG